MSNQQCGQRILVATDFSPYSHAAWKQAVWLARRNNSQIVLANVCPDLSLSVHWGPQEREMNQRELCQRSETTMRQMIVDLDAMDLNVKFEVLIGEPCAEITHAVQAEGCDIILAGTRGLGKWEQFFIGSTAKRLIQKCPSAVWVVKAEHPVPPKVVLAATDFSDVSFKAVKEGLWIAQQSNARFHLLHIIDSLDVSEDVIASLPKGSSVRQEINAEATRRLDAFRDSLGGDPTQIQLHLSLGTPSQEIQRMSQHLAADVIAIGTIGRGGAMGLLLGNTAEKLLDTCDCSILAVKPDGFVSSIDPVSPHSLNT